MRRFLAALMLVLLAMLAGGDPLLCPDGCNDEPQQQASAPSAPHSDCLACRNAISTAMPLFSLSPDDIVQTNDEIPPQTIADSTPLSIDHPPRFA